MIAPTEHAEILTRAQVDVADTWELESIYPDEREWEAAAERLSGQLATVTAHRGMLGDSAMSLLNALDDAMKARLTLEHLMTYAALRRDEDTTNTTALARYERATAMAIEAAEALAYVEPEILALPAERLEEFVASPMLGKYRFYLEDLSRRRPHVRSIEVEEVLAQGTDTARTSSDAFGALDNADLTYGTVHDDEGREVELTKARYGLLLESQNREVRREAHETLSAAYLAHRYTLASLHASSVRKDVFYARVHRHDTARAAALFGNNIPETVYDSLLEAVKEARPALERFLQLRARALGVDQLALYDLRVPLAPTPRKHYEFQEAVDVVLSGLEPLGDRYVDDLAAGFGSRWVDVHETKGKRSGAYSWGAYGVHPVILMNWNGTLSDVFTLAHEAGHAMHSFYADAAQPYHEAQYTIFLAEIASTLNEVLLTWHLLAETPEDDLLTRFDLLNRFADTFFGTLITQALYADFELATHRRAEGGEPLTVDVLSELFSDLQRTYLPGVEIDEAAGIRWGRIPHFYRAFYVYQYATGISAAVALAKKIRDEGEPAAERYRDMLKAGGSDYSLNILQRAGVDLTSPEPVRTALEEFQRTVVEMERLVDLGVLEQKPDADA
ncbi:MAG TPA: oligoendopeptidase F [Thermomicrobiales bacterium]|nr:oligoendopeptidase F [Thermomicrobiales bacterium]